MELDSNVSEHGDGAVCPTCGKPEVFEHPDGQLRHCFSCGENNTSKPPTDVDAVADGILRASHRHLLESSEAQRYLVEERGLHPQVVTDSAIGLIPADLDVSQLFMSSLNEAET